MQPPHNGRALRSRETEAARCKRGFIQAVGDGPAREKRAEVWPKKTSAAWTAGNGWETSATFVGWCRRVSFQRLLWRTWAKEVVEKIVELVFPSTATS